jgi:G3E family GTPase
MDQTPFYIVTGFLGSGKTTFLKNFLNQYANQKKIAVIQNEFASASIDGKELKKTGKTFFLLELNKGSVFCVCLLADFKQTLLNLLNQNRFDGIILEASGMADPISIAEIIQAKELKPLLFLAKIWTIVDGTTFLEMETKVKCISHQIRVADQVLINKIDKPTPPLQNIHNRIRSLNPWAEVNETSYSEISLKELGKDYLTIPVALKRQFEHSEIIPTKPSQLFSTVIRSTRKSEIDDFKNFLKKYASCIYRLKGMVVFKNGLTAAVQYCYGELKFKSIKNYYGPTEIIAIGPDLNTEEFYNGFREMTIK